jgi:hypothetical protein
MLVRLLFLIYFCNPLHVDLATFLSIVLVNSSKIVLDLRFNAISALNPSPTLNTFLGLHQTGIEFNPTALNLNDASSGVSKFDTIALVLSYDDVA